MIAVCPTAESASYTSCSAPDTCQWYTTMIVRGANEAQTVDECAFGEHVITGCSFLEGRRPQRVKKSASVACGRSEPAVRCQRDTQGWARDPDTRHGHVCCPLRSISCSMSRRSFCMKSSGQGEMTSCLESWASLRGDLVGPVHG